MISYSTLGTSDMERSITFYDAVFGALGATRESTTAEWTQYGRSGDQAKVCLTVPYDKNRASGGNGAMLAFKADSYDAVDKFHSFALDLGGTDEGAPGIRDGTHYVAYIRDPDGNKLCAFTPK
ncbi:MAG: VOC family protein [Pseudomonadota bacterium]